MKSKTVKDCNVLEAELLEKILDDDMAWIPIGRSLSIGKFE
jgi:hypothetical protein